MTDDTYDDDRPKDPAARMVHDLLYTDPDEAGSKLRGFVQNEAVAAVQGHAFMHRRSAEIAAAQALVAQFKEQEPDWADGGVVEGAMTQQLKNEQVAD
jgi:hypothetical protein